MPIGPDGRYYEGAKTLARFDVGHRLITATGTSSVFTVVDVSELYSTLNVHEHYVTSLTGSHNDIVWIARAAGDTSLTVTYTDPSANDAELSVTYDGGDIEVNLATDESGAITTTANDIINYVLYNEDASEVEQAVVPVLATSNNGSGVVTALSQQSLADGTGSSPTLDVVLQTSIDGSTWVTAATFAQVTAADTATKIVGGLANKLRWSWTIGGTASPRFAVSIRNVGKRSR